MNSFVKVLIASGCAAMSGGINVWLNIKDKKTISKIDIIVPFVSPMLMVMSTCMLFI